MSNMKRTRSLSGTTYAMAGALLGVVMPSVALAGNQFGLIANNDTGATFTSITNRVISIILFVGGAAAILYLLWSGFQYVTAGGDDEKAGTARKGIINAIIGIVIISAAYLIFNASRKVVGSSNTSGAAANL